MKLGKETLRVAVVGLGKMGLLHTCILNVLPNVKLTALCEKSAITRKFLKKVFNEIHIVDDLEKLSDLNLDMVYVTTPIPSHFPIVRTLYLKKIARNLFVEKTLASSYDESKELCELAQNFGGVNMVGYLRRFAVTFRKAKDLLVQDAIGETVSFKAHAYSSDFFGVKKDSEAPAFRGGVLRDLGCHAVDLALWFFGDLQVEYAKLTSVIDSDSEDSAHFRVIKPSGLGGEFDISWCVDKYRMPEVGLLINGSKGTMKVDDDKLELKLTEGKSFTQYRHDLQDNVAFWLGGPEYFRENECFVKSVISGHNADPSFHIASKVDQIIDKVRNRAEKSD
jgi:predicted dehydrogenase